MNIDDERLGLLSLLVKLDIVGMRKVSYSMAAMMIGEKPPLCSVDLAIVSLSRDFIHFAVKKNYTGEYWLPIQL
jgi:hypothetical protein